MAGKKHATAQHEGPASTVVFIPLTELQSLFDALRREQHLNIHFRRNIPNKWGLTGEKQGEDS